MPVSMGMGGYGHGAFAACLFNGTLPSSLRYRYRYRYRHPSPNIERAVMVLYVAVIRFYRLVRFN